MKMILLLVSIGYDIPIVLILALILLAAILFTSFHSYQKYNHSLRDLEKRADNIIKK